MSKRGRYDPEFKQGTGKAKTLRKLRVIGQNVVVCEMPIDRHCLIEQGHIVYTGTQSEFAADPAIRNRYLALGTT